MNTLPHHETTTTMKDLKLEEPADVQKARKKLAEWESKTAEREAAFAKLEEEWEAFKAYTKEIEAKFWPCPFCGSKVWIGWEGTGKGWVVGCSGTAGNTIFEKGSKGMKHRVNCPAHAQVFDQLRPRIEAQKRRIHAKDLEELLDRWNRRPATPFIP